MVRKSWNAKEGHSGATSESGNVVSHQSWDRKAQVVYTSTKPRGQGSFEEGWTFVLGEWCVRMWVRKQNLAKGLAPLSGIVWSQREKGLNAAAPARLPNARPAKQKHQLQWLRRWRLRKTSKWVPSIQAQEHGPAIECQNKAATTPSSHHFAHQSWKKRCSPIEGWKKRGSGKWTVFWGRLWFCPQAWGPKAAPLFQKKHKKYKMFGQRWDGGDGAIFCTVN
jgi:hypothetical protein